MSEIQDLKNYILSLQQQINNLSLLIQNHAKKDDNLNEILNLVHNTNFERERFNHSLFENVFPDIMRRLSILEAVSSKERRNAADRSYNSKVLVSELNIPKRIMNIISFDFPEIKTIEQLSKLSRSQLLKVPNIAHRSVDLLDSELKKLGFSLDK